MFAPSKPDIGLAVSIKVYFFASDSSIKNGDLSHDYAQWGDKSGV
jgi:hypothetical protein